MTSILVPPHGGELIDPIVTDARADELRQRAAALPEVTLDAREAADLELIAVGAASPLRGFLGETDYRSVLEHLRLFDGTVWPLPFTLAVVEEQAHAAKRAGAVALTDVRGRLWGVLQVASVFQRDPLRESRQVYGTEDSAHPGVAYLLGRPTWLLGGAVEVLPLPDDLPFAPRRLSPSALRAQIEARGWRRVAGFQTRNPIHRAHEHLTKLALEFTDGLVLHPLVGETKSDDVPAAARFFAYEALLEKYYPPSRTLLAAFPAAMRYAGPREALFHALARKNYGINQLIIGRDHAGVGNYYEPYASQQIFDRFTPAELGITPLKFEPTFFCKSCANLASERTCPHGREARLALSGSAVRQTLREGGNLPAEFTRPEVAEILRAHYVSGDPARATVTPLAKPAAPTRGFILWLTGLSGAGKSTLAGHLHDRLTRDRAVQILDGDEIRTYLSKGLGFEKEDRDTNIRRIGYVARLLARNGVVAISAAISPYAEVRDEVRELAAGEGIPFIEVYVAAELESLIARDVKGLYKKALAGEIAHFTGVSDPYEAPREPELVVRSDRESVHESVEKILAELTLRGLDAPRASAA